MNTVEGDTPNIQLYKKCKALQKMKAEEFPIWE